MTVKLAVPRRGGKANLKIRSLPCNPWFKATASDCPKGFLPEGGRRGLFLKLVLFLSIRRRIDGQQAAYCYQIQRHLQSRKFQAACIYIIPWTLKMASKSMKNRPKIARNYLYISKKKFLQFSEKTREFRQTNWFWRQSNCSKKRQSNWVKKTE